jgi:hypothetical protein
MKILKRFLIALTAIVVIPTAHAGQNCEARPLSAFEVANALQLAKKSFDALDQSGASVAIIARAGQNLSRYGLTYSHLGIVWRDHPDGRWTVVHLLNHCGTARGDLFNQGLGDFFMDSMFRYQTLIMIPSPAIQARIADALTNGTAGEMFSANYNMLAYPFATDSENSNQWALEMLAASLAQDSAIHSRAAAQGWLSSNGYRATTLHLSAFERLGAELTRVNISFDNQPFDRRMSGEIDTVTVDSIEEFLRAHDSGLRELRIGN